MAAKQQKSGSVWRAVRLSWGLLTASEKRRGASIAFANVFVSLLDTISLVGVMPLVSVIIEPELLVTNRAIRTVHSVVGAPPFDVFVQYLAVAAVALLATSVTANYLVMALNKRFRVACQNRLAEQLMSRCVQAPYDWLLRQNATALAHHVFNDVLSWGNSGIQRIVTLVGHLSLLLLATIVVLAVAPFAGMAALLVVGALATAIMLLIRSRVRELSVSQRAAAATTFTFANEVLAGIKDVKLSGREPVFVRVFGNAVNTYGSAIGALKLVQAFPPLAMLFLGQAGVILIAVLLWGLGKSGGEIAAEMALVLLVSSRVIPTTIRFSNEIGAMWNIVPNLEGIGALLRELPSPSERVISGAPPHARSPAPRDWRRIEFVDLGYRYSSGEAVAIQGISAVLEREKSYGLAGPSGSGKTTLIDLLLDLLHPSEGDILIDGTPLTAIDIRSWQKRIGYVPQNPLIADDTLLANVAFGLPAEQVDEERVVCCLEMADLGDVLESVTLRGRLGDRGNRLSGGQRQRVAIARALYDEPDLLVFDEATSALDTLSERAVRKALDNLHGKVTTVTVAHRLTTIERCDEILLLDRGRLVARGNYETLLRTSPLFRNLVLSAEDREEAGEGTVTVAAGS